MAYITCELKQTSINHMRHWVLVEMICILFCYLRQPFHSRDFIGNSPNCFPYNCYHNYSKNFVLDQLIIP